MKDGRIIFTRPAGGFFEKLPIGNGRMGALVSGSIEREEIVLNENSMWSGSPEEADREDAAEYLPEIRRLLAAGRNFEAEEIYKKHFTCRGAGSNYAHGALVPFGCYQLLGTLRMSFHQMASSGFGDSCNTAGYRRELDLESGKITVSYTSAYGISFRREMIAPQDPDVLILRLTADRPGEVNFSLGLDREERGELHTAAETAAEGFDPANTLIMSGQLCDGRKNGVDVPPDPDRPAVPDGSTEDHDAGTGVRYACAVQVYSAGGRVCRSGMRLLVSNADSAVVIIAARTDMKGFMGRTGARPLPAVKDDLDRAARGLRDSGGASGTRAAEDKLFADYDVWYRESFGGMELALGAESERKDEIPTPERLRRFKEGEEDPGLFALYLHYARYLIFASSRKGDLPANLQGIWAEELQTPWNGDWHLNAQQQIYWLAEQAGLPDVHLPYLELTRSLAEPGRKTAKAYYGAGGWVVHTMTNPWGFTSPLENASWGSTATSGAWLCRHLFDHYLYTGDRGYLEEFYPVMKEAAQFFMDMLVENGNGRLVTSPASSPENCFVDEEGRVCSLSEGSAYDQELITDLLENCLMAERTVKNRDKAFEAKIRDVLGRMEPLKITSDGRIMEWDKEYREAYPYHRHLSNLWGVCPGFGISPDKTPELAEAALRSLRARGKTTAGWAVAHRASIAARLREQELVYEYLSDGLRWAAADNLMNEACHCDEVDPDFHRPDLTKERYPFQMDGNEALGSVILLSLLDDEASVDEKGEMHPVLTLLPALPAAWPEGRVKGVRARGALMADLAWENGKLVRYELFGAPGQEVTLKYGGKTAVRKLGDTGRLAGSAGDFI